MSPTVTSGIDAGIRIGPRVDIHLDRSDIDEALRRDVAEGLGNRPYALPPKWFYDDVGSALFDTITRLDEYYQTRAERQILLRNAGHIMQRASAHTMVELGSGTSDKTKALLDAGVAIAGAERLHRFVPFDVSGPFLGAAAQQLAERYPSLEVHGVVGDFDHHLSQIPTGERSMVVMLGGTIGNYAPGPRRDLLAAITATMESGDHFLLGTDLVKEPARLELAYDDPAGVTAAFNRNVLAVVNRSLSADFDLRSFSHVARWDPDAEWIEMHLRAEGDQRVRIEALDLAVDIADGETIHTEISAKFRPDGITAELDAAGLDVVGWWTDDADDFAVSLSRLR